MLLALALTLSASADDCVPEGELIVIQDDLMLISTDQADELEFEVETMITDDRVPWRAGDGAVITADAAVLSEGRLRRGFSVDGDSVWIQTGSTGLTINEHAFLIAGMGTEVVVFMTGDHSFGDNVISASSMVVGPAAAIEEEIPEDAVQVIPSPTCVD